MVPTTEHWFLLNRSNVYEIRAGWASRGERTMTDKACCTEKAEIERTVNQSHLIEPLEAQNAIQPLYTDEHGTLRFKSNAIVRYLLDNGGHKP